MSNSNDSGEKHTLFYVRADVGNEKPINLYEIRLNGVKKLEAGKASPEIINGNLVAVTAPVPPEQALVIDKGVALGYLDD
jgi:hypothetical protein